MAVLRVALSCEMPPVAMPKTRLATPVGLRPEGSRFAARPLAYSAPARGSCR